MLALLAFCVQLSNHLGTARSKQALLLLFELVLVLDIERRIVVYDRCLQMSPSHLAKGDLSIQVVIINKLRIHHHLGVDCRFGLNIIECSGYWLLLLCYRHGSPFFAWPSFICGALSFFL